MFMYLDEVPEGQLRDDLAMLIEEVLRQRIKGVKNEQGVWVTPAFPFNWGLNMVTYYETDGELRNLRCIIN